VKPDLTPPFGPGEAQDGYTFGPFRLDVRKRRLWKNGALVPVTPKAFETLLALVNQPGTIIDKDDLLKRVWPDTFVNEETLTQNISTLRKVLGDTSDQPEYIATIPRRGYQFIGTLREQVPDSSPTVVGTNPHSVQRAAAPGASWTRGRGPWIALAAGAIVGGVALGLAYIARTDRDSASGDRVHLVITPPDGTRFAATGSVLALSPDGTRLAFVAVDERGVSRLWLRVLGSPSPRVLEGTEDAAQPFWSADGTSLAFTARGKLRRIALDAGTIQTICDIGGLAGTWNRGGVILFAPRRDSGIFRVSADGGVPVQVTSLDKTLNETDHLWPVFLPDGQHFLFFSKSANAEQSAVYVGSIDEPRTRIRVMSSRSSAEYAWPGYLLFRHGGVLVARAFDTATFRLTGEMTTVAERVVYNAATGRVPVSASPTRTGVIAFRTWTDNELVWVDRSGRRLERVGPPGPYSNPALSRDGSRVAAGRLDPSTGTEDIWVIDMARGGIAMRLTSHPAEDTQPLWSPDGERVVFNSNRTGQFDFYEKPSNGSQDERVLFATGFRKSPIDWSHDGRSLLYYSAEPRERNLWVLPLEGPPVPRLLPRTEFSDWGGELSRDGRWLAYVSSESGVENEVFIQSFPETGQKWQISSGGGREPHWRSDGRELFFLALDDKLMSVMIEPGGATTKIGAPRALFPTQIRGNVGGVVLKRYAVAPDGQRFLLNVPVDGAAGSPIHVIVNWPR